MAKLKVSNPLDMGGNPPLPPTMEEVASEMYGALDLPTNRNPRPRDTKLVEIKPDVKQPRRIIPAMIRRGWTGDVAKIPNMIREWRAAAERELGKPIDMVLLLDKQGDGREADKDIPPIADEYLALCALAASIKRDGLANAIQVTRNNVIVTGERRYMAHWLLHTWLGGWDSIPAVTVNDADVWLQAAENGARKPLNAIGMARQLALLIMEMYHGDDGVKFDDIGFFNHEQQFYAQVANGNIWRIKKGLGERILQVTGLKSLAQVNQYRALLGIPNDLWDESDMNNYAEFRIREMVKPRDEQKVNSVYTSTTVEVSAEKLTIGRSAFNDRIGGLLRGHIYNTEYEAGLYTYRDGAHAFVWWNRAKKGYEVITFFGGREEATMKYSVDDLLNLMWASNPSIPAWQPKTKESFYQLIRPRIPSNQPFAPKTTPEDNAKDKKFEAFKRAIEPKIAEWQTRLDGYGIYTKSIYEQHIWVYMRKGNIQFLRDNEGLGVWNMDDLYTYMFRFMPDANTWKVISQSEYDKLIKEPATVDVKAVMHDMGIGDDDEYPDDDDDVDEETRELARQENAQIDADFAQYVASQPPLDAPRPEERDTRYVVNGSLLHHFVGMLAGWMQARGITDADDMYRMRDFTPDGLAGMAKHLTGDEIAQVMTVWGDVVIDAMTTINNQLADMQARIWDDVPAELKKDGE